MRYYRHVNRDYIEWALDKGFRLTPTPVIFQLYSEPMQKMRLAARGHGAVVPPEQHRARIETYFDPLPFWYPPFEDAASGETEFPMHAITQRPMAMYHSGARRTRGSADPRRQPALHEPRARQELGIEDDDWVWITSRIGRVKAQVKLMEGVNPDTVWTWNAIGKRAGAWGLDPRRARGHARLPAQSPDRRAAARAGRRLPLLQQRSRHGPGRLVRPQGAHREGGRP